MRQKTRSIDPNCCQETKTPQGYAANDCLQQARPSIKGQRISSQTFNQQVTGVNQGAFYVSSSPYNLVV